MLERLISHSVDTLVRVYCQPDRPKGRGKKVGSPPVKQLAESAGIPVSQPLKLKDGAVAQQLTVDGIDLAVVVAYGRILPPDIFNAPKLDTWNVHASLLPKYRGASPIQHAILNQEKYTGVTIMQLRAGLDEGPMLLSNTTEIGPDETTGQLMERLANMGAHTLIEGIQLAKTTGLEIAEQDHQAATYAPLIQKSDGSLQFDQPAALLAARIRGLSPWPGTFIPTPTGPLKILSGRDVPDGDGPVGKVGHVHCLNPLQIQTTFGRLEIDALQAPGRKAVSAEDYLRGSGRHLKPGASFP